MSETADAPAINEGCLGSDVWSELGSNGSLREVLTDPDPRFGFRPSAARRLLTDLDASAGLGPTLSVCVQIAAALPLLRTAIFSSRPPPSSVQELLERALDGHERLALAATDGGATGSDLAGLSTTVKCRQGGCLVLNGTKRWIVNAMTAGHALALARHAPGRHVTSFTLVLVPLTLPGVHREPADTDAFTGAGLGDLVFDDVSLPATAILGGRGRGMALFARQMAGERLASGLWAEALAGRALVTTRYALQQRRIGDQTLWSNTAVRHDYARAVVEHQRLQALNDRLCGDEYDARRADPFLDAALVKAVGATTLDIVLAECCRLAGADGFRRGGIQQLRAEAAMFGIAGGTTATMLDLIADHTEALVPSPTRPVEAGTQP